MSSDSQAGNSTKTDQKRTIGGFEIIAKLGQGAMGAVFKARQVSVDRIVALKVLPRNLAKNENYLARFLREAHAAAKLDHVNIVQGIDAGEADGYHYFAMEFVDGNTLRDVLTAEGQLSERHALEIARDVARALDCAHEAGLIHRDVKPDNVLIASDGTVKLADLGLARETERTDSGVTQVGTPLGTPNYISPEQVRGEAELDGRTDIYSLGAMLYHLLAGLPPYRGGTQTEVMAKHLTEPTPDLRDAGPELSEGAAAVIWKAMAKERDERYPSAKKLIDDIESVLAGRMPAHAPDLAELRAAASRQRGAHGGKRPKWVPVAGVVAAIFVVVALVALLIPKEKNNTGPGPEPVKPREPAAAPVVKSGDKDLLAAIQKWAKGHPDAYREAVRKFGGPIGKMADPVAKSTARAVLSAMKARAAERTFAAVQKRAAESAKAGDYDAAVAAYGKLPAEFKELLFERGRAAVARLGDEAEAKIAAAVGEAEELAAAGKPADAIARLDALSGIRYEPGVSRVRALRERLAGEAARMQRADALARAKKAFEKLLSDVESAAANGELAKAPRLAGAALAGEALKPVEAQVRVVAAVCKAMATLDAKQRAVAAEAFRKYKGQTVTLRTKQGALKQGKVKDVTEEAVIFEGGVGASGRMEKVAIGGLSPETLARHKAVWSPGNADEAVAAAIVALVAKDADAMAAALKKAAGHSLRARYAAKLATLPRKPAGPASPFAGVPKLFRGKVLEFDPETLHIKLLYDFNDSAQVKDWSRSKWYMEKGGVLRIAGGALRLSRTRMQALTRAQFTSAAIKVRFAVSGGSNAVTLVACADGAGSHYELCGLWYSKTAPKVRCQLMRYMKGKAPLGELGKKWPLKASPYGATRRGTLSLSVKDGRIRGQVGSVILEAADGVLKSGRVGVWAYDAHKAGFDDIEIEGTLDPAWVRAALGKAGLAKSESGMP